MMTEAERFNINHPNLCHCLRWKSQFIQAEPDPTVPASHSNFWCVFTAGIIGPDGKVVGPADCSDRYRACHGRGEV